MTDDMEAIKKHILGKDLVDIENVEFTPREARILKKMRQVVEAEIGEKEEGEMFVFNKSLIILLRSSAMMMTVEHEALLYQYSWSVYARLGHLRYFELFGNSEYDSEYTYVPK